MPSRYLIPHAIAFPKVAYNSNLNAIVFNSDHFFPTGIPSAFRFLTLSYFSFKHLWQTIMLLPKSFCTSTPDPLPQP